MIHKKLTRISEIMRQIKASILTKQGFQKTFAKIFLFSLNFQKNYQVFCNEGTQILYYFP